MFWTEEKISELKRLCGEGMSASQIGAQIGATRSAVIGKAYRIGVNLNGRGGVPAGGRNKNAKYWTDEEVQKVRELAADGKYALHIADIMGVKFHQILSLAGRHGIDMNRYTPSQEADRKMILGARLKRKYARRNEKRREAAAAVNPIVRIGVTSRTHPSYRNQLPRLPEMSKAELRAMLAQAVRNTAEARA
ncbi:MULTISPECIES: GcrA family cell cycle regulator [unclassified Bradyrhizobium]